MSLMDLFSNTKKYYSTRQMTFTLIALGTALMAGNAAADHTMAPLFVGGTEGYHSYRIPALITTPDGTLLAICEGRKNGPEDYGDIDLVYKRSTDHGVTWSPLHLLHGEGAATWGNPTPVADRDTGRLWLFLSWNAADHNQYGGHGYEKISAWGDRRLYLTCSDDQGRTWSTPKDLSEALTPKSRIWDAVGPGNGIQTLRGPHPGRLIVPAIGRNLYSDDHGATWHTQPIGGETSEGTLVELIDGRLLRNDRSVKKLWTKHKRRMLSVGQIGEPWGEWYPHEELYTPRCQASSIRYDHDGTQCLLFLNPASTERRWKMRIKVSDDDGATWAQGRFLPGPGAPDEPSDTERHGGYSSLSQTADGQITALVEYNTNVQDRSAHKNIVIHRFDWDWITTPTN